MSSVVTSGPSNFSFPPEVRFRRRLEAQMDAVEATVQSVFRYAQLKAQHLSERGHDLEYVMSLIFDRGSMLHPMSRYSTTRGLAEIPNDVDMLDKLRKEFNDEFDTLRRDDKDTLSHYLKQNDPELSLAVRSLPSNRVADVDALFEIMKGLFLLLKCRCGVDGFICLTRNNYSFDIMPKWFFSTPGISTYLLDHVDVWDIASIAYYVEQFSLSVSPDKYATWLRQVIEGEIDELLVQVTRRRTIRMDYENYEKAVVIDLGVELVGWSHPTFARPSTLPPEIEPLQKLLRDVKDGLCCFQPITDAERARRLRDYTERTGRVNEDEASEQAGSGSGDSCKAEADSKDVHEGLDSYN